MKRNYPLRKLDKKECRKTGIPYLHIPLSQKMDCSPKTSVLLRSRIKRIGRRNVLLLCLYPVEGQLLLFTSPDRILFQGRQDYTTLDFLLYMKDKSFTPPVAGWLRDNTNLTCFFRRYI